MAMNTDAVLAELDAQYQDILQSVDLEGLATEEISERSENQDKPADAGESDSKHDSQNVDQIIRKYGQILQSSRAFYEAEIEKLESTKTKTDAKYVDCKKRIKELEHRLSDNSDLQKSEMNDVMTKKDAEIDELKRELNSLTDKYESCCATSSANEAQIQKLQSDSTELHTEIERNRAESQQQAQIVSDKKSLIERYKVEIFESRQSLQERETELATLQKELRECREEINFLCTTNEDLQATNEKLGKQLEAYPQVNSLWNSMLMDDIENVINDIDEERTASLPHDRDATANQVNADSTRKENQPSNNNNLISTLRDAPGEDDTDTIHSEIMDRVPPLVAKSPDANDDTQSQCPKLRSTTSVFMMTEAVEDAKIKEELLRLQADRNLWTAQYQQSCAENGQLKQQIAAYASTIEELQSQLQQTQLRIQQTHQDGSKDRAQAISATEEKYERLLREQQRGHEGSQGKLKMYMSLDEENKRQLKSLNEQLLKLANDSHAQQTHDREFQRKEKEIVDLGRALSALEEDQKSCQLKLEQTMLEYRQKAQHAETQYNTVLREYQALQREYHDQKLQWNERSSKEGQFQAQMQKLETDRRYALQELQQCKEQLTLQRSHSNKQAEEISQMGHDLQQSQSQLESVRMQLLQSQHLIQSLEKQMVTQSLTLQHTRNQLQMQMQMNVQNLASIQTLKNVQMQPLSTPTMPNARTASVEPPIPPQFTQSPSHSPEKSNVNFRNTQPNNYHRNSPNHKFQNTHYRTTNVARASDMMNIARGKPLSISSRHPQDGKAPTKTVHANVTSESLGVLLHKKEQTENLLFRLPTNPRSLVQRKRKHELEAMITSLEDQIDCIKRMGK